MNKPTNVLRDNLPGVANVTYDLGKAQGKGENKLVVEYDKHYDNTYGKLEENPMEISTKKYIEFKDKDGEKYRIDIETEKPLIAKGQDEKKVKEFVKEFLEAIKEIGLKLFSEMLEEGKLIGLGEGNTIDIEQVKKAAKAYLEEKEEAR